MINFRDGDYYYFNFTDQFITENKDKIDIWYFSNYQMFNTKKIKKYYEIINFNLLNSHQRLSEELIDLLLSKTPGVNLSELVWYQKVSNRLIDKYSKKITFDRTALVSGRLSKNFILKYYKYFLMHNRYLSSPKKFVEQLYIYPDKFKNRMFNKLSKELKKV